MVTDCIQPVLTTRNILIQGLLKALESTSDVRKLHSEICSIRRQALKHSKLDDSLSTSGNSLRESTSSYNEDTQKSLGPLISQRPDTVEGDIETTYLNTLYYSLAAIAFFKYRKGTSNDRHCHCYKSCIHNLITLHHQISSSQVPIDKTPLHRLERLIDDHRCQISTESVLESLLSDEIVKFCSPLLATKIQEQRKTRRKHSLSSEFSLSCYTAKNIQPKYPRARDNYSHDQATQPSRKRRITHHALDTTKLQPNKLEARLHSSPYGESVFPARAYEDSGILAGASRDRRIVSLRQTLLKADMQEENGFNNGEVSGKEFKQHCSSIPRLRLHSINTSGCNIQATTPVLRSRRQSVKISPLKRLHYASRGCPRQPNMQKGIKISTREKGRRSHFNIVCERQIEGHSPETPDHTPTRKNHLEYDVRSLSKIRQKMQQGHAYDSHVTRLNSSKHILSQKHVDTRNTFRLEPSDTEDRFTKYQLLYRTIQGGTKQRLRYPGEADPWEGSEVQCVERKVSESHSAQSNLLSRRKQLFKRSVVDCPKVLRSAITPLFTQCLSPASRTEVILNPSTERINRSIFRNKLQLRLPSSMDRLNCPDSRWSLMTTGNSVVLPSTMSPNIALSTSVVKTRQKQKSIWMTPHGVQVSGWFILHETPHENRDSALVLAGLRLKPSEFKLFGERKSPDKGQKSQSSSNNLKCPSQTIENGINMGAESTHFERAPIKENKRSTLHGFASYPPSIHLRLSSYQDVNIDEIISADDTSSVVTAVEPDEGECYDHEALTMTDIILPRKKDECNNGSGSRLYLINWTGEIESLLNAKEKFNLQSSESHTSHMCNIVNIILPLKKSLGGPARKTVFFEFSTSNVLQFVAGQIESMSGYCGLTKSPRKRSSLMNNQERTKPKTQISFFGAFNVDANNNYNSSRFGTPIEYSDQRKKSVHEVLIEPCPLRGKYCKGNSENPLLLLCNSSSYSKLKSRTISAIQSEVGTEVHLLESGNITVYIPNDSLKYQQANIRERTPFKKNERRIDIVVNGADGGFHIRSMSQVWGQPSSCGDPLEPMNERGNDHNGASKDKEPVVEQCPIIMCEIRKCVTKTKDEKLENEPFSTLSSISHYDERYGNSFLNLPSLKEKEAYIQYPMSLTERCGLDNKTPNHKANLEEQETHIDPGCASKGQTRFLSSCCNDEILKFDSLLKNENGMMSQPLLLSASCLTQESPSQVTCFETLEVGALIPLDSDSQSTFSPTTPTQRITDMHILPTFKLSSPDTSESTATTGDGIPTPTAVRPCICCADEVSVADSNYNFPCPSLEPTDFALHPTPSNQNHYSHRKFPSVFTLRQLRDGLQEYPPISTSSPSLLERVTQFVHSFVWGQD